MMAVKMDYYSSKIIELCYVSRARGPFDQKSFLRMIDKSRKWNEQHDLTSIVFYANGGFCQILEGTLRNVDLVCRKISSSSLHHKITHLETRQVSERTILYCPLRLFAHNAVTQRFPALASEMMELSVNRVELVRAIRAASIAVASSEAQNLPLMEGAPS